MMEGIPPGVEFSNTVGLRMHIVALMVQRFAPASPSPCPRQLLHAKIPQNNSSDKD